MSVPPQDILWQRIEVAFSPIVGQVSLPTTAVLRVRLLTSAHVGFARLPGYVLKRTFGFKSAHMRGLARAAFNCSLAPRTHFPVLHIRSAKNRFLIPRDVL